MVRASRLLFWAASAALGVSVVRWLASTVIRLLQDREPPLLPLESLWRLTMRTQVYFGGAHLVAEAVAAIALVLLARSMASGAERPLLTASAVAAVAGCLGQACIWTDTIRVVLLDGGALFGNVVFAAATPLLSVASVGGWLVASTRLLRSAGLRAPRALTLSLAVALGAQAILDGSYPFSRLYAALGRSTFALWGAGEIALFASAATALVAYHVWQAMRRFERSGSDGGSPRGIGPYRAPEDPEAAARERSRRAAFDAAQAVRIHTSGVLAYAGAAVIGVLLAVYIAGWHKFYPDCAVRQALGSLCVVALLVMALAPTSSTTTSIGTRVVTLVSLGAWCLVLADLDRLQHFMDGTGYGDAFYGQLNARDALFTTTDKFQVLAQVTAIAAIAAQGRTYATMLAFVVGALAIVPITSFLLGSGSSVDLALFAESCAKSPLVQGTIALAIVCVANFYRSVSLRLASAMEAQP